MTQQLGKTIMSVYSVLIIFLVSDLVLYKIDATSYASLSSVDGNFKIQWTYNNSKLIFKMTCKTPGWCAVGFTTTADGKNMVDYDIAIAGYASSAGYIDDYWSSSTGNPPKDGTQNYDLISASESGGTTVVEFSRDAVTGDNANDVQFMNDTEVKVVYAYHTSTDANAGLSKHTNTGILDGKHNLILMAMSAMQPSSIQPSQTVMPSTSSRDSGGSTVMPKASQSVMPSASSKDSGGSTVKPKASQSVMPSTSLKDSGGSTVKPPSYAVLSSPDGFFKLQWTYNNSKELIFKMTCKTTGWCAVGFTTTDDGKDMKNYDIAVAGYASGAGYIDDYWSSSLGKPPKDGTQNYDLIAASESDGTTVLEFSKDAVTGDNDNDVEFLVDTEVTVVWASLTSSDANSGLSKHSKTGIISGKHNLIKEALLAMQPNAPIPTESVGAIGPNCSRYIVLAWLSVYYMCF